jgi:Terminase small subunit
MGCCRIKPRIEKLWSLWNRGGKMGTLKNIRHERFAQNVVSGLSLAAAYISAGYKDAGANANGARLMRNDSVSSRVNELWNKLSATTLQLQITDREQRLLALQDRWDRVRQAISARAVGDYAKMMQTGIVCRKVRVVGSGKNAREIEEYDIDTSAIEALNTVERRAAIETGQEQENVNVTGQISAKSIALSKVMSLPELEELERKMAAAMEAEAHPGKVIEPPKP